MFFLSYHVYLLIFPEGNKISYLINKISYKMVLKIDISLIFWATWKQNFNLGKVSSKMTNIIKSVVSFKTWIDLWSLSFFYCSSWISICVIIYCCFIQGFGIIECQLNFATPINYIFFVLCIFYMVETVKRYNFFLSVRILGNCSIQYFRASYGPSN